jgi:outer membrane receptor protein involved in Fe transport
MENDGITSEIAVRPVDKLYFKAWANYLGKRPKSTSGYLNSTVILGGRIEYRIMNNIGIYVSGDNLLNKKYMMWTGYKEMPLQIFGGITLKR